MTRNEISVAVGGGHELDQAGLAALIASLPGLRVVSIDRNPPPQVLVWETSTAADKLPSVRSNIAILLLTQDAKFDSLPDTVMGLLSKAESPAALGIAIRQVARGEQYLSPSLATAILEKQRAQSLLTEFQNSPIDSLTEREREILNLLAQGLSNKMIAAKLYLSVRTVEGHMANIYSQLGVHSRTEAMLLAVKSRGAPGLPLHRAA